MEGKWGAWEREAWERDGQMTERQQKNFYFPAWRRCAVARDWVMEKKRLVADLVAQRREALAHMELPEYRRSPAAEALLQVLDYAEQLAAQEHRRVTDADLRHGCNLVATGGKNSGSSDLNNHEVNRVVVLFRLLQEPEDLDAVMEWLHPDQADKRSLVSFLKKLAPDATLVAIARNAFRNEATANGFWEDLDLQQLRWLLKQVKGRQSNWNRKPVEEPF